MPERAAPHPRATSAPEYTEMMHDLLRRDRSRPKPEPTPSLAQTLHDRQRLRRLLDAVEPATLPPDVQQGLRTAQAFAQDTDDFNDAVADDARRLVHFWVGWVETRLNLVTPNDEFPTPRSTR